MSPKQDLDHRSFFSLGQNIKEFIQIISFLKRSSFKLRCETVIGIVLCCIFATVVFTCTSLPFNLYTSVFGCGCGFGFEQNILADLLIWWKKGMDRRICISIPLFTPLMQRTDLNRKMPCVKSGMKFIAEHHKWTASYFFKFFVVFLSILCVVYPKSFSSINVILLLKKVLDWNSSSVAVLLL